MYDGGDRPAAPANHFQDFAPSTSDPDDAQGLQSVDSRPAASRSTLKRTTEGQSTEDESIEFLSYQRHSKEDPNKSTAKNDKSLFSLLDCEVDVKQPQFTVSAPPPIPDYFSIQQNKKRRRIKIIPRVEPTVNSDGDAADASEGVSKAQTPAEGVSCCSEAEGQMEPCREISILKPLNPPVSISSGIGEEDGQGEMCDPAEPQDNTKNTAADKEEFKKKRLKAIGAYILEASVCVFYKGSWNVSCVMPHLPFRISRLKMSKYN